MVNSPKKKCFLRLEWLEARDCPTAGALDLSFGVAGIAIEDFNGASGQPRFVAIQPDQKIVVAGIASPSQQPGKNQPTSNDFGLMRFNSNGTLDTTFGTGGKLRTDIQNKSSEIVFDGAIQSDGKIVIAGTSANKFAVARYNTNGTLDTSFSGDGLVTTTLSGNSSLGSVGMALQPDGKIVLGSRWTTASGRGFALVRYNANGSLDTSFDGDGISTSVLTSSSSSGNNLRALALQSDGRILAEGSTGDQVLTLARYNANGSLDTLFGGGDGHVELTDRGEWNDVTLQSDRIVLVGYRSQTILDPKTRPLMARFDSDGVLDPTFGSNGLVVETSLVPGTGFYAAVNIQVDGKIVAAGRAASNTSSYDCLVARYSADGALDTSFGGTGTVVTGDSETSDLTNAEDMAIQSDGKIVVVTYSTNPSGITRFAVARFLSDDNLSAAAAAPASSSASSLKLAQAQPLLTEAIARWQSAGFNVASLSNINLRIADLPGTTLGQAQGNTITLDSNAAGWGWFVDKTPKNDSEFRTRGNQGEQGRMDLLSVLMHETGHLLGIDHQRSGIMADTLFAGVRRSPITAINTSAHSNLDLFSIFGELRSLNGRKLW